MKHLKDCPTKTTFQQLVEGLGEGVPFTGELNKYYALFCANAGFGDDKTLYICRITPEQFEERFGNQPWIANCLFMLAYTEQEDLELAIRQQGAEWTLVESKDKLNVNTFPYFTRTEKN